MMDDFFEALANLLVMVAGVAGVVGAITGPPMFFWWLFFGGAA